MQWAVNAYLLSLAALFAFGGRLADTVGHRKMVTLGVIVFAGASAMCGLTPKGSLAEAWIVTFRVVQGAGGAIMFPAALAIVVQTFALRERGKALALFFGIAGGLTAIGPILGGYLTEWTWRAIFWVNIPVAHHRPGADRHLQAGHRVPAGPHGLPGPGADRPRRGAQRVRLPAVVDLGLGQPRHLSCASRRASPSWSSSTSSSCAPASPLIQVSIFRIRPFLVENLVLGIAMLVFIPVFFFASEYAQIALGKTASQAGLFLLYFFIGFVVAAQIGGRMLDRRGAKRPVVLGCALAAVGFWLWAGKVTELDFSSQQWYIVLAGAGMGLMLGPASTDAVNRASRLSYGEATGITQTVRNYAASLGLAILGTILVTADALPGHHLADRPGRAQRPGQRRGGEPLPVPGRQRERRRRSRTSCGSTSPTPPAPCSTSWRRSWPWRRRGVDRPAAGSAGGDASPHGGWRGRRGAGGGGRSSRPAGARVTYAWRGSLLRSSHSTANC